MKKSDKLTSIIKFAHAQEQHAAQVFGACKQKLNQNKQKLAELASYRADYLKQLQQSGQKGMSASEMRNFHVFLEKLDLAIEKQKEITEKSNSEMERQLQNWKGKYRKNTVIANLKQKHIAAEDLEEQKREQKEIDNRPLRHSD